jgi:hypothetical protein
MLKHISAARNMHTTTEELSGVVFSNFSMLKLYKEGQQDLKVEKSNSGDRKIW